MKEKLNFMEERDISGTVCGTDAVLAHNFLPTSFVWVLTIFKSILI